MRNFLLYISGFLVLLLLQEFVISSINFSVYVAMYIYTMVVVLFPLNMKPTRVLLASTLFGVVVDIYSGTGGLSAICMAWLGFIRPYIAKLTLSADVIVAGGVPYSRKVGERNFFKYVFLMSIMYLALYTFMEIMSFDNIGFTVTRILVGSVATTLLIYVLQLPLKPR